MYPVEVVTLFPDSVSGYLGASILGKAQEKGLLGVTVTGRHLDPAGDVHHEHLGAAAAARAADSGPLAHRFQPNDPADDHGEE